MSDGPLPHPLVRVGIVVAAAGRHDGDLVDLIVREPRLDAIALILRPHPRRRRTLASRLQRWSFGALTNVERASLREPTGGNKEHLGAWSVVVDLGDLSAIEALKLDAIVCADGRDLPPSLTRLARYGGVWLHFDLADSADPHPVGFAETVQRTETVEFDVRQSGSQSDEFRTIFHGQVATQAYYTRTHTKARQHAARYLVRCLLDVVARSDGGVSGFRPAKAPASLRIRETPPMRDQARYAGRSIRQLTYAGLRRVGVLVDDARWHVAFARGDWSVTDRKAAVTIPNPPGHWLADPFVVERGGQVVCFVEDYDYVVRRGSIAAYRIDTPVPERLGTVVEEDFHLSFPFVFEYEGDLYICPESEAAGDIRIYRCVDFPLNWELASVAIPDLRAVDTVIFEYGDEWRLLTTTDPVGLGDYADALDLYSAPNPLATEWTRCPANPVVTDLAGARNGGFILENGRVLRVAQNPGSVGYGYDISIRELSDITVDGLTEVEVARLGPDFSDGIGGTHHLHSTGNWTVFDYWTRTRRWRPFGAASP